MIDSQYPRSLEVNYPETPLDPDESPIRSGIAVLIWVAALASLATSPAAVIWAWRWFL